ncbi:hypothetical protein BCR42DRAFT_427927 [Absidia repens]|uniref:F-box domain-containing protein n=1 Tax=Absidia repens TaxID=90262 RepID=A0A1X2HYR3_9FUNG|nr:hypothetical protein BCR42DRAFT_427927 [Absidia repens]
MTRLDHLPSELISLILRHVSKLDCYRCLFVNKSFYKEAMPLFWHDIYIDDDTNFTTMTASLAAMSNALGKCVRRVYIMRKITDDELLTLVQHVPLLKELVIYNENDITDASFMYVPQHVPHLTRLSFDYGAISHLSTTAMGQHWHQLRDLFLIVYDYNMILPVIRGCRALETLVIGKEHVRRMHDFTAHADPVLFKKAHTSIQAILAMPHLTQLSVTGQLYDCKPFLLTPGSSRLTALSLGVCKKITDAMVLALIQSHPSLRSLALRGSPLLTDATLDAIAMHLPQITDVAINYNPRDDKMTHDGLRRLALQCPQLKTLVLTCHQRDVPLFPTLDETSMCMEFVHRLGFHHFYTIGVYHDDDDDGDDDDDHDADDHDVDDDDEQMILSSQAWNPTDSYVCDWETLDSM